MNKLLSRLKLLDSFKIDSNLSREEFLNEFKKYVDTERKFLADILDQTDKKYIGEVGSDTFEVKRKRSNFLFSLAGLGKANGKLNVETEKLSIEVEVFAEGGKLALIGLVLANALFLVLGFGGLISLFLESEYIEGVKILGILLIFQAIFTVIPIILMQTSIDRLYYELDNDMKRITKR